MSLGFGFALPAIETFAGGPGAGSALNLDFTSGNNTLSPAITFSRTTNATLTNSAGLVANAPMNLLTYSEQFDNASAWGTSSYNVTVSANTTAAPNGTITADSIVDTLGTSIHGITRAYIPTSAGNYRFSVYIKAGTKTSVKIREEFSTGGEATFNLVAVTATGAGSPVIESVGNGWFRCSATWNLPASYSLLNISTTDSYAGTGATVFYLWGAQLELGSTATTYNPTTVKNLLGYTENFDNAAWTKSNAFVQTNQLLWSEDFTNAAWAKLGGTTASSANTLNFPNIGDVIAQATVMPATVGTTATFSVVLSGTGTTYIGAYRTAGGPYEETKVKITLTSTPTRYTVTHTIINAGQTGFGGFVGRSTDGTATTVTATQAQLVNGASAGNYQATYGASAPVGYTDIYGQPFAQKLVESAITNAHIIYQNLTTTGPYTVSVFAKSADRSTLAIRYYIAANNWVTAVFNLATGVVSQTSNGSGSTLTGVTPAIQSVGNGWYRCSLTATGTAILNAIFMLTTTATPTLQAIDGTEVYLGDGTSGIYIFGAQLSDSASVDPYVYQPVAAPTSTAYYGPRFDYDPVTLQPKGLLIEEQRTNLVTYSEQFDNVVWAQTNATITANASVAPNGTSTADKLIMNSGISPSAPDGSGVRQISAISSGTYQWSVYAKAGEFSVLRFRETLVTGAFLDVNLVSGIVTNGDATQYVNPQATPVGNGWWRVSWTSPSGVTAANKYALRVGQTGDGVSGIYIWGYQLEAGAFATSYIPTVASQVTRAADNASMIGNNFARWYNVNEGTMYAEGAGYSTANGSLVALRDSLTGYQNQIPLDRIGALNAPRFAGNANGVSQFSLVGGTNFTAGTFFKLAGAYQVNSFAASFNGGAALTDNLGSVPVNIVQAEIGRLGATQGEYLNGTLKRIAYYPRRLTNTELQGITS